MQANQAFELQKDKERAVSGASHFIQGCGLRLLLAGMARREHVALALYLGNWYAGWRRSVFITRA